MPLMVGAEPFLADPADAEVGIVLAHGFTGTPQSMRPWGEYLARAGFAVRCPRLPGHGTRWQDMNATRWSDWYATVAAAVEELRERYGTVFVFGLSMGGTLTLRVAEEYGDAVAGICLVNPSVTTLRRDAAFLRYLAPWLPYTRGVADDIAKPGVTEIGYDRTPLKAALSLSRLWTVVRDDLARVRCPVLLYRSATDHVVEPVNAQLVLDGIRSRAAREVVLPDSFHVATLDHDAQTIFSGSADFARAVATGQPPFAVLAGGSS